MSTLQPIRIGILGGGQGGSALLELLLHLPEVTVIGLADNDPAAPGLIRAKELHLKAPHRVEDLILDKEINFLVNVTGNSTVDECISAHKRPEIEVLNGAGARLLWTLVQHETRMQAQLFRAEKLATIGTFASGLAHDINNPLYLILGLAENLQDEQDPAAIKEQAKEIAGAVQRISALSKDLTHYARQSNTHDLIEVELTTKLDEALKISQFASQLLDVSVLKTYAARPILRSNPDDILHVFVNLITNAIHAMDGKGTLTLGTMWDGDKIVVTISDTGSGITQEHLSKIFDPFFTTKPPDKGTGLGLYNVQEIVKKFHGTISVKSEIGTGTTFIITFPKT